MERKTINYNGKVSVVVRQYIPEKNAIFFKIHTIKICSGMGHKNI